MNYSIDRYLNVKLATMPSISSDGRWLAFISDLTGVPQAWRAPLGGSGSAVPMPEQLTFAEDRVLWLRCSPAPGDTRLLFTRDRGGNENTQLYLLDPTAGQEHCLTTGHDGAMHIPGHWSPDGHTLLFAANRAHPAHFGLYRQMLDEGQADLLWQSDEPGLLYDAMPHPTADRVLFSRTGFSAAHHLLELDLSTGQARRLDPPDRSARYHSATYSLDGDHVYVVTDLDSDRTNLMCLDLNTGQWETVIGPYYELEYFSLSPDGRTIAFTLNQDGYSRLELLELERGVARPGPTLPDGVLGIYDERIAFSPDSTALAFAYTTPRSTSNVYYWEWATMGQGVRPLTQMTHGGIPTTSFVDAELIRYPTFDGRLIPAWLYRPRAAATPMPVVVTVHGGPEWQARPWFDFLAQYLVNRGYAVLAPNVRGSTGYGNAYSHLDDVERRLDSVSDLAYAACWLAAQAEFDGRRIAVQGGSYGGYMVLASLTHYSDRIRAGVDVVGISHFGTFLKNTESYRRDLRRVEYGDERDPAMNAVFERISPLNNAHKITSPLFVAQGRNDPRVPWTEAEQIVKAVRGNGQPVWYLLYADEGHGFAKKGNSDWFGAATILFWQQHLLND